MKRDNYVNPFTVIWPQYCLGVMSCWYDQPHRAHFWTYPSGHTAVYKGVDD